MLTCEHSRDPVRGKRRRAVSPLPWPDTQAQAPGGATICGLGPWRSTTLLLVIAALPGFLPAPPRPLVFLAW